MPAKEIFVKRRDDHRKFELDKFKKVAYLKGTIYDRAVDRLSKQFDAIFISNETIDEMYDGIYFKTYDYLILDNISIWEKPNLVQIEELKEFSNLGLGFMYPKKSNLKKRLDKYLLYYMKSSRFKKLLTNTYSQEVRDYFIKAMFR